jgi:hypothetical protein
MNTFAKGAKVFLQNFVSFWESFCKERFAKSGQKILAKCVNCLENCKRNF